MAMNEIILYRDMLQYRPMRKELADYVAETLVRKGIKAQDVENRTNKRITRGYVSRIVNRTAANPSMEKLEALADGLGVPLKELISTVYIDDPANDEEFRKSLLYMLFQRMQAATDEER